MTDGLDEALASAARALARGDGVPGHLLDADPWVGSVRRSPPDGLDEGPDGLGRLHQQLLDRETRLRLGVFHTPMAVARPLVELALAELGRMPQRVLDPAVGGGALLIATADALVDRGVAPATALGTMAGSDVDPLAVRVADWTLRRWAWCHGLGWQTGAAIEERDAFETNRRPPVDLLVTNPPFGGRLRRPEATESAPVAGSRNRFGELLGPYADVAAAFLLAADEMVAHDGVGAYVLPTSLLASRDAEAVRSRISSRRRLAAVWADPPRFDGVAIATLGLVLGPPAGNTTVVLGGQEERVATPGSRWSRAVAVVPALGHLRTSGSMADVAEVIAPFRDEYYGLVPAVVEGGAGAPLVTSGLIDPGVAHWGGREARFAKRRFDRPTVVPELADAAAQRWIRRQQAPKVLVASQTNVIEAVADPDGSLVGVTPVVAVVPNDVGAFEVLAVLLSPVASALVRRETVGTGLNPAAMRVTGPLLAGLPLPADLGEWRRAAELLAEAHGDPDEVRRTLPVVHHAMLGAYGVDHDGELARWWQSTTWS